MAIRFHGTEGKVIPRSALVESLHKVLDRSELADMVIPDLAKWNDWSQIDRLTQLFKDAEKDKNWLRVPVINYLRACPLPEAEKAIGELEKIDPEAVRRAKTFFPIPVPVRPKTTEDKTSALAPIPVTPRTGARYAAVVQASGNEIAGDDFSGGVILATAANPWDLGYVITIALASIVLALFLVLTGGPATGAIVPVMIED